MVPVSIKDYEKAAQKRLTKQAYDYYRSGSNDETTLHENEAAYTRLRIMPRFLEKSVENVNIKTTLLGQSVSMPICVSPTAFQKLAYHEGEAANARACQKMGTIFTLSTLSNTSIEDVAKAEPSGLKWFQLYVFKDRSVSRRLVERAERNGYKCLVITIDMQTSGVRYADKRNRFMLPSNLKLANFEDMDQNSFGTVGSNESGLIAYVNRLFDQSLVWEDVKWLKSITKLPLVVKGVLSPLDAENAIAAGADAIFVSNHGGRQLNGAPATIEVLPEVIDAVNGRVEVYVDGGIRNGSDLLKALAMGAKACFVGRPVVWGLSVNGEEGVRDVLTILRDELVVAMKNTGVNDLADLNRTYLRRGNSFWSSI